MMRYSKGKCEVLFGYKKKLDTVLLYGAPKGRNCCFWQNSDPEFSVRDKIENRIVYLLKSEFAELDGGKMKRYLKSTGHLADWLEHMT